MKKITTIAAALLIAASFSSCKKEYTCTCVTKMTGADDITQTYTFKAKKKDAEASCNSKGTTSGGGVTMTTTCKLN
jgi:uncharacterized lipoprotein YehR (DUF1307 family)